MNDENKPNSIVEARISKLKKRRRAINNGNSNASANNLPREKLATIAHCSDKPSPCHSKESSDKIGEEAASAPFLGFVNRMNRSDVRSITSSIVGDIQRCSRDEFHRALNRSFDYRFQSNRDSDGQHKNKQPQPHRGLSDHPLVGTICVSADKSTANEKYGDSSIAFPRSDERDNAVDVDHNCFESILRPGQFINLTGNGSRIPWSCYQFPNSRRVEEISHPVLEDHSLEKVDTVDRIEEQHFSGDGEGAYSHLGRIRIESDRGASIRDAFDIDNARVLGRLKLGDERFYLDNRLLPPPQISAEDSEEECVAVVRYRILLEEGDVTNGLAERDEKGRLIGWISDRGRCADDLYSILCEL